MVQGRRLVGTAGSFDYSWLTWSLSAVERDGSIKELAETGRGFVR